MHFGFKGTNGPRGWKRCIIQKAAGHELQRLILMSDKMDFNTKSVIKDEEGCLIMIKGPTHQENTTELLNT